MRLPEQEYAQVGENGRLVACCTLRQKALHTIGLNSGHVGRRLYTRHGRKFYRPFRNYFSGNDHELDKLVEAGYMDVREERSQGEPYRTYWLNRAGLDWLGGQLGIVIRDEEK